MEESLSEYTVGYDNVNLLENPVTRGPAKHYLLDGKLLAIAD